MFMCEHVCWTYNLQLFVVPVVWTDLGPVGPLVGLFFFTLMCWSYKHLRCMSLQTFPCCFHTRASFRVRMEATESVNGRRENHVRWAPSRVRVGGGKTTRFILPRVSTPRGVSSRTFLVSDFGCSAVWGLLHSEATQDLTSGSDELRHGNSHLPGHTWIQTLDVAVSTKVLRMTRTCSQTPQVFGPRGLRVRGLVILKDTRVQRFPWFSESWMNL